jgi:CBS-domain-containing membrane protein
VVVGRIALSACCDGCHRHVPSTAGINPLLVVSNNFPWSFLFAPVLAGAVLLAAFAYVWHRRIRRRPWPRRWF